MSETKFQQDQKLVADLRRQLAEAQVILRERVDYIEGFEVESAQALAEAQAERDANHERWKSTETAMLIETAKVGKLALEQSQRAEDAEAERDAAQRRADVNHESAAAYRLCAEEAGVNVYHVRDWIRDSKAELTTTKHRLDEAEEKLAPFIAWHNYDENKTGWDHIEEMEAALTTLRALVDEAVEAHEMKMCLPADWLARAREARKAAP